MRERDVMCWNYFLAINSVSIHTNHFVFYFNHHTGVSRLYKETKLYFNIVISSFYYFHFSTLFHSYK